MLPVIIINGFSVIYCVAGIQCIALLHEEYHRTVQWGAQASLALSALGATVMRQEAQHK